MFDRILLPTDGDEGMAEAVQHAIGLAETHDAVLDVIYVVDESVYSAYSGEEFVHEDEGPESALERLGEDAIASITEQAADRGVTVESALRYGDPHEEIIDYAAERDVDVIVMGTKQRSGEYRQLLGSVTDRVSRLAGRPVTIVKTPVDQ